MQLILQTRNMHVRGDKTCNFFRYFTKLADNKTLLERINRSSFPPPKDCYYKQKELGKT